MTYYLAANDRTLAVLRSDGLRVSITLKSHPFSKGLTKAQAAVSLMALIGNRGQRVIGRFEALDLALKSDDRLSGLFFNDPPQDAPIVRAWLFSLDCTSVENWLRKVFGDYRDCLPPVVSSLQQQWETWTGTRWIVNAKITEIPSDQVELAIQTHMSLGDVIAEKQEQRRQGEFQ